MNKKIVVLVVALISVIVIAVVGFTVLNGKNEVKEPTKPAVTEPSEVEKDGIISDVKEEDLLKVARELNNKFDEITLAKSEEEFDKLRKELFVDYEFYAPMSEFDNGKYSDVKTTVSNEKLTKAESYYVYDFNYKTVKTLKDGQQETEEGKIAFEIIKTEDGSFKVTVVR